MISRALSPPPPAPLALFFHPLTLAILLAYMREFFVTKRSSHTGHWQKKNRQKVHRVELHQAVHLRLRWLPGTLLLQPQVERHGVPEEQKEVRKEKKTGEIFFISRPFRTDQPLWSLFT